MKPLRGVVVGGGRMLEIRLASGRIVSVPHTKGIRRWDAVNVSWDYVKGRAVSVEARDPDREAREITDEPETLHGVGEEGDSDSDILESGALLLSSEWDSGESGFWDLELSDGSLAAGGVM